MKKSSFLLFLLGITIIWSSGCTTNEFNDVQHAIENQIQPAKTKTHLKLNLGPFLLFPVKTIVNLIDTEDEASPYLDEIMKVQVGVYKIKKTNQPAEFKIPDTVKKVLHESGWETFVRVREKNEMVECYYKLKSEDIIGIYAIVLDDDNLVIAEVRGRLDKIIEKAIQEHGFPLKDIFKN